MELAQFGKHILRRNTRSRIIQCFLHLDTHNLFQCVTLAFKRAKCCPHGFAGGFIFA